MPITIERCHLNGTCTQRWEALETVRDNPRMRYCNECAAAVHLVEREAELARLAELGKSVAIRRD